MSGKSRGNSTASAAAALLEHYFGGLTQAGLRCSGFPGGISEAPIESADSWWHLPDNRIVVFGSVIVDRQLRRAYVKGLYVAQ